MKTEDVFRYVESSAEDRDRLVYVNHLHLTRIRWCTMVHERMLRSAGVDAAPTTIIVRAQEAQRILPHSSLYVYEKF